MKPLLYALASLVLLCLLAGLLWLAGSGIGTYHEIGR